MPCMGMGNQQIRHKEHCCRKKSGFPDSPVLKNIQTILPKPDLTIFIKEYQFNIRI